jgi:hypothetical protein
MLKHRVKDVIVPIFWNFYDSRKGSYCLYIKKNQGLQRNVHRGVKELLAIYETNKKELSRLEGVYKIIYVLM